MLRSLLGLVSFSNQDSTLLRIYLTHVGHIVAVSLCLLSEQHHLLLRHRYEHGVNFLICLALIHVEIEVPLELKEVSVAAAILQVPLDFTSILNLLRQGRNPQVPPFVLSLKEHRQLLHFIEQGREATAAPRTPSAAQAHRVHRLLKNQHHLVNGGQ